MATMEGPLSKWTNVMKGWQYRWFVLDDNAGLLSYYTSKEKMMRGVRRGCVRLKDAAIGIDDDDDSTFTITVDGKIFHFQARDPDERDKWIHALEETILRHAQFHQRRWKPHQAVPTIQDFDKKLTETDAYLQILIEQIKNLETRLEKCEDDEERSRCLVIRDNANAMLESIKHSIVFLQIAKNTAHPVNGIYQVKPRVQRSGHKKVDISPPRRHSSLGLLSDLPLDTYVLPGIEPALECLEEDASSVPLATATVAAAFAVPDAGVGQKASNVWLDSSRSAIRNVVMANSDSEKSEQNLSQPLVQASNKSAGNFDAGFLPQSQTTPLILPIPETSYSSSEDEDYFDAQNDYDEDDDNIQMHAQCTSNPLNDSADKLVNVRRSVDGTDSSQVPSHMANKIDFDAIYEDDDEEELGSVEGHGSVISHLLSQVKLGMDLTKVVLPTFILERRSLLEMYADFFAHPDLFVSIINHADPCERMVQVMRWYLSAFHAGRKSSVAKKPFNPILGETFRCHWDIPGLDNNPAPNAHDDDVVTDGPVPWVTKNQLAFIAEQVSHHPPISAFYAEHYNKRISFAAHIWTKSKFLGLSIGVHMIGQGCVSLLDHDEEYIVTFPNGYGRSILTVPWVELGGTTTITCAKTGYNATVEFQTKPFYGGKKHRVSAEVFQPNEKRPFVNITGEWNGCMTAKWADGRSEVFVDTLRIPIVKKIVPPVANQEPLESRRLWKEVSAGLKLRNINRATDAKFQIEQRQRFEAKERKEKGMAWETRFFHENGANWIYDRSLEKRLTERTSVSTKVPDLPS